MQRNSIGAALATVLLAMAPPGTVSAQTPPGAPTAIPASAARLAPAEIEKLVAPIALYPDDLLAIMLPAATTPLDLVKGQRFLDKRKSNPSLQPDKSLAEPVRSLLNYPDIVKKMTDDLDWTEMLGQAVTSQQKDVIDAIQGFRRKTYAVGNLKTDAKQVVVIEKEVIKIVPADPQVIYVPQYQPSTVVVVQSAYPVAYYPTPYPVYYYPYPPGAAFATGLIIGAVTANAVNWNNASIHYNVNVNQLQQERMDYANNAREDRQAQSRSNQAQRQQQSGQNQAQRQEAVAGTTGANQAQRQSAAASAQGGRGTQSAQRPTQMPAQASASGGAFGGMDAGAAASRSSDRGAASRYGGGSQAQAAGGGGRAAAMQGGGGFAGGGRGGGGGRAGGGRR